MESLGEEVTRLRAENKLLVDDNVCLAAKVKQLSIALGLIADKNETFGWMEVNPVYLDEVRIEYAKQILSETPAESLDAIKAETIHELIDHFSEFGRVYTDQLKEYADTLSPVTGE